MSLGPRRGCVRCEGVARPHRFQDRQKERFRTPDAVSRGAMDGTGIALGVPPPYPRPIMRTPSLPRFLPLLLLATLLAAGTARAAGDDVEVEGAIEALAPDALTVGGLLFAITDPTAPSRRARTR